MTETRKISFLQACWRGDLEEVTRQLDAGARINQIGTRSGLAGVHIAIKEKNEALLRLLMERGATAFSFGEKSFGKTRNAVELAVEEGLVPGLCYLLDERKLSLRTAKKSDPAMILFKAIENGRLDNILMLRHLVEVRKLDPLRAVRANGYNLLHAAELNADSLEMTEYLLEHKIDPNDEYFDDDDEDEQDEELEEEYREESPPDFEIAVAADEDDVPVEHKTGPDSNNNDDDDFNPDDFDGLPLAMAAHNGLQDRVLLYLKYNADPGKLNANHKTAFDAVSDKDPDYEFMKGSFTKIREFLTRAQNGQSLPKPGNDKFLHACARGDLDTARQLLALHKDEPDYINKTDEWNISGLHIAMRTRNLDLLRLLIENNADPYQVSSYSKHYASLPVEAAVEAGFLEGLEYLVEEKKFALWPVGDRLAEDLLFSAGTLQVLKWLVEEQGLDPHSAISEGGEDLLMVFEKREKPLPFLEYLLDHGMNAAQDNEYVPQDAREGDYRVRFGGLPLVRAVFNGNVGLIDLYLRHHADPLQPNQMGGNSAIDALDERSLRHKFAAAQREQIGKMLEKAIIGHYGERALAPD